MDNEPVTTRKDFVERAESSQISQRSFEVVDPEGESSGVKTFSRQTLTTVQTTDPADTPQAPVRRRNALAHLIVESKFFVGFTTLLTFYALAGDDCRLIFTERPWDWFFDWMVVLCIFVFTVEVILSCVGKDDYFPGFFFYLDVASTISLGLDITAVSELIAIAFFGASSTDGEEDNASNMRSGRSARLGARLGRILRVLRLIRILKLYKAFYEAKRMRQQQKRLEAKEDGRRPGEEDEWDDSDLTSQSGQQDLGSESRVGKKLSEMTTRKTICLILAMLLVLPFLKAEVVDQTPVAPAYGADVAWKAFQAYLHQNSSTAVPGVDLKAMYESAMLQLVYYHNWFAMADSDKYCPPNARDGQSCPDMYYGQLFWFGIVGRKSSQVMDVISMANLSSAPIDDWERRQLPGIYNIGTMPEEAKAVIKGGWDQNCDTDLRIRRGVSLLARKIEGLVEHTVQCPDELRMQESIRFYPQLITEEQFDDWHFSFYYDVRQFTKWESVYNLAVVVFILALLILGSLMFTHDANRLVVHPVEKMIRNVKAIRANPLIATQMADEEFKQEEITKARLKRMSRDKLLMLLSDLVACKSRGKSSGEPMETVILEKTIIKLGSLLALGFGEAGANIIRHNMTGSDTAMINAMVPGTTVDCIIGVTRVRDFSVATEVLQAKINTFVNKIAEIIHGVVYDFHGAPNKNSGDTFLVIWRIDHDSKALASRMAEMALVAFSKILGAVHRSPVLADYRTNPGLQYRLGSGCRVNLSFGLHKGWAIEGAVGSEFKIDASYLSPHVGVASNMERATLIYGVSIVVAQSVVELCSKSVADKCRLMDKIKIGGGSMEPMELYCVDLDYRMVPIDVAKPVKISFNTHNRFKARQFLQREKALKLTPEVDIAAIFDSEEVIAAMRKRYTTEFFQFFNMGYQNYKLGEWQVARRMLSCTTAILGIQDGPSTALLRFMEVPYQFEAPPGWEGVRELGARELDNKAGT